MQPGIDGIGMAGLVEPRPGDSPGSLARSNLEQRGGAFSEIRARMARPHVFQRHPLGV
jgi:hypothetical protein